MPLNGRCWSPGDLQSQIRNRYVPMLHDIVISAIVLVITLSPMAFSAWYESREARRVLDA
jgi:hypothetical protein